MKVKVKFLNFACLIFLPVYKKVFAFLLFCGYTLNILVLLYANRCPCPLCNVCRAESTEAWSCFALTVDPVITLRCVTPSVHLQVMVDYVFQDLAEITSSVPKVRPSREISPCRLN